MALCLTLGLTLAPAASAAFTATDQASTSFSTATLPVPSTSTVSLTATCATNKKTLTINVGATGPLPYANALQLTVSSGGSVSTKYQDLTPVQSHTFTAPQGGNSVTFDVELRAAYKVPNSTNVWTGLPFTRTVLCS